MTPARIAALAAAVLAPVLVAGGTAATDLNGPAQVADGNSIAIGGVPIRLRGIDAPDEDQICQRDHIPWRCGQQAAWALAERLERHWVLCDPQPASNTKPDAVSAICYLGGRQGINVNAWMVEQGWAVSDRTTNTYLAEEHSAQAGGRGLWSGDFEPPWSWRQHR